MPEEISTYTSSNTLNNVEATPSRLTNADFRKLLMTPRSTSGGGILGSSLSGSAGSNSATSAANEQEKTASTEKLSKIEERRRRKNYYAKLKRDEDDILAELSRKYRDLARERRDREKLGDIQSKDHAEHPDEGIQGERAANNSRSDSHQMDSVKTQGGYRAVAPDLKSVHDAAERRRRQIQESKFLGGDMEHTHLVKGLDYALLQKVRTEIQAMEQSDDNELESVIDQNSEKKKERVEEVKFKTALGRNIYDAVFGTHKENANNQRFLPHLTAYLIDLDDDYIESDIPVTIVRCKADTTVEETSFRLTTSDIVINKLANILSYLRQGNTTSNTTRRIRRKMDKNKGLATMAGSAANPVDRNQNIFDGLGEYSLIVNEKDNNRNRQRESNKSYFPSETNDQHKRKPDRVDLKGLAESELVRGQLSREIDRKQQEIREKERFEREKARESNWLEVDAATDRDALKKRGVAMTGFMESYPGVDEIHETIDDSDEEVDFTKMDQGNRKGPVGRWDFNNQSEYNAYMSRREAMPKAAFQFGVKMSDGRKTRGDKLTGSGVMGGKNSERAELDREWQKISAMISKRRPADSGTADVSSKRNRK